jgi:putative membrane protein
MKTALLLSAAVAAALSMSACSKATTDKTQADAAAAVNAGQDAAAGPVGQMSAQTIGSHDTPSYVANAAQADWYEVEAGKMAQTRGKAADVKAFGKMMADGHTATTAEMKPLAAAAGQTPPITLDERRQGLLDNLKAASDADFDRVYVDQQVAAHEEALSLHSGYAANGDNAGLKAFAAKTAPVVQMHLDKANGMKTAMK